MKEAYNILWIPVIATLFLVSCIKEDLDDCPLIILEFECINRDYFFNEVTDELELLFYHPNGTLAYDHHYTADQLRTTGWKVFLTDEITGKYTLVAHINYNNEDVIVLGKENRETLSTEINYNTNREIDYVLKDTWYGRYELELDYTQSATHTVMLSKNTNLVHLIVLFEQPEMYWQIRDFDSRIIGKNALYGWNNRILDHKPVSYLPFAYMADPPRLNWKSSHKTMRIWTTADLKLEIYLTSDQRYQLDIDIPQKLINTLVNGTHPYDTNEELEHYDEFEFEVTIGADFNILEIKVNGWYTISQGVVP